MKKKILGALILLGLVLTLSLMPAIPAMAAPVTLTVTGPGDTEIFGLAEMDQHFSTETIDASSGDTILSGQVALGNFDAGNGNDVWYEVGLVSNETYLGYSRLHNKGVYMIALWTLDYYKVHMQNVGGYENPPLVGNYLGEEETYADLWGDSGLCYFKVPQAVFQYEIVYHDVTTSGGLFDLRISTDGGTTWSGWKYWQYAENDEQVQYGMTEEEIAAYGYADDDDLTNARVVSQLFVESATTEIFTATYDNIQVNGGAAYALEPRVLNTNTGKGYAGIQVAIDDASGGNTISVGPGTYDEAVFIDKSLTLNGAKAGVDARIRDTSSGESIVDGSGLELDAGVGAFNISDGVSNVIIDGFEACNWPATSNPGNGSAVMAYSYGGATQGLSQITIQNNYMHDLGWNGVLVWSNNEVIQDDFTIQFNLIEEAPYAGIELTNVTNSQVLSNKIIAPTVIANDPGDAGVGIEIAVRAQPGITISAGNVLVEENEITGTFAEGSRAAINILSRTYASASNATLTGVTVRNNTVSANVSAAIFAVAESHDNGPATISNLIVDGNTISEFSKSGIVVKDVSSVQIEGNTISTTDHTEATNGIQIGYLADSVPASTGTAGTVNNNQISDCHWSGYDPAQETYEDDWTASGILVIDTESALEISGNGVQNCDVGLDIETGSETIITNNDVHDNSYGFVLWNANPTMSYNNIYQNALYGVYRTNDLSELLDATNNWWGNASGPVPDPLPVPGYDSYGDTISANVDAEPWLLKEVEVGVTPTTYEKTLALKDAWTMVSVDKEVTTGTTWVGTTAFDEDDSTIVAYAYKYGGSSGYTQLTLATLLTSVDAYYIKTDGGGGVGINYSTAAPGVVTKDLAAGWNIISCASETDAYKLLTQLRYVQIGEQQGVGITNLIGQASYNQYLPISLSVPLVTDGEWTNISPLGSPVPLNEFNGCWVYMNAAKSFGVIPD